MRRVIAAAAIAVLPLLQPTTASADACVGSIICGLNGCTGTVNVCPGADSCSGGVSVCPGTDPDDCHSTIDVCPTGAETINPCAVLPTCRAAR